MSRITEYAIRMHLSYRSHGYLLKGLFTEFAGKLQKRLQIRNTVYFKRY